MATPKRFVHPRSARYPFHHPQRLSAGGAAGRCRDSEAITGGLAKLQDLGKHFT
jgi:hypothetical protein